SSGARVGYTYFSTGPAAIDFTPTSAGTTTVVISPGVDTDYDATGSFTLTYTGAFCPGPVTVSELRLTGPPGGAGDQYVELSNDGPSSQALGGWSLDWTSASGGTGSIALHSVTLPPGGHYLITGTGYSLAKTTTGDQTALALPADLNGVQVVAPGGRVFDSVGDIGSPDAVGTGLTEPSYPAGVAAQIAFVRRFSAGEPVDTGDNQADFALVAPDENADGSPRYGQPTADPPVLGVPSPLDTGSPVSVNAIAQSYLLDSSVGEGARQNLRYTPPSVGGVSVANPGVLVIGRTIKNQTSPGPDGKTITALQIRLTGLSTFGAEAFGDPGDPAGGAVLDDVDAAAPLLPGTVATALTGVGDGGLNSVLSVPLPLGGLGPQQSISVTIAFDVYRTGSFAFAYNLEGDLKTDPLATGGTPAGAPWPQLQG
ncbi:MAG: lamin tail domain-containing protein, partial [Solirubrobacteraceae bacterium]